MPGWSKCNICNKFKCPGSGRLLLTLNQICYQSCRHLCRWVTTHLVLVLCTPGLVSESVQAGGAQSCTCKNVLCSQASEQSRWWGQGVISRCVSTVTPAHEGVQDWLCSEVLGGWMCYLCGWKESALPNLQQNVLLKHILCVKSLKMSSKKTRVFKFNHSYILLH